MKQGLISGWAINVQIFPNGENDHDLVSSVDIYPTWDAVFNQSQTYRAGGLRAQNAAAKLVQCDGHAFFC